MMPLFEELVRVEGGREFSDQTDELTLLCPNCEENYLHQIRTDVYNRAEDADEGIHATIKGEVVIVDRDLRSNPSSRRQGLSVEFFCECCHGKSAMTISQHKGNTIIKMYYVGKMEYNGEPLY